MGRPFTSQALKKAVKEFCGKGVDPMIRDAIPVLLDGPLGETLGACHSGETRHQARIPLTTV